MADGGRVRLELSGDSVRLSPERHQASSRDLIGLAPLAGGQRARAVIDELRHDEDECAALRAGEPHPNVRFLEDVLAEKTLRT